MASFKELNGQEFSTRIVRGIFMLQSHFSLVQAEIRGKMNPEFNLKTMKNAIQPQASFTVVGSSPGNELHRKFVILGNNRRKLTNELLALLPEIYERGIYKKYAATIVEYAGKFGGLSKGVVKKRLGLEKYLKDKPNLKEAIKTEGIHKVALIAKLATKETENAWVDKVKNMSKAGLFELAKEVREKIEDGRCTNGCGFEAVSDDGMCTNFGFCKAAPQKVKIELEGELLFMFLKMKKKYGNNLSNYEVMKRILEGAITQKNGRKNRAEICNKAEAGACDKAGEKVFGDGSESGGNLDKVSEKAGKVCGSESEQNIIPPSTEQKVEIFPGKKFSRYIKTKIKNQTLSSTNGKCSYPGCGRPSENFHHPERFAESRNHENLKPLCKIHHEFMHNGLVENEKSQSGDWRLNLDGKLSEVDGLYRGYRKLAGRN